ncbi:MAG: hypothetical protein AUG44_08720 [Actinobacteria bacterium 13_1_20CM_3_71_11]|nr:MAG: hypothetical protein AUG44_08720 [Actinobacteria bacterium 13_1_20CM_3_71_11]
MPLLISILIVLGAPAIIANPHRDQLVEPLLWAGASFVFLAVLAAILNYCEYGSIWGQGQAKLEAKRHQRR